MKKFTISVMFTYLLLAFVGLGLTLASCEDGGGTTKTFTVRFNANSGSGTVPGPVTVKAGKSITLPGGSGLSRDGHVFGGWNTQAAGTGTNYNADDSYAVTGNVTLYAKWNAEPLITAYTVIFDANGATDGTAPIAQTVPAGSRIILPSRGNLSRTGYTFGGWNERADGTGQNYTEDSFYTPVGDIINIPLYAKWDIKRYTVTFESNEGGTVSPITGVNYDSTITKPTDPAKNDYTFNGWFKDAVLINQWNFTTDTVTDDTILYAKWTLNQYTVIFDANGAVNGTAPSAQTVNAGSSITLPNGRGLSKISYTFGEWNTQADGAGITYNATSSYMVTGNITLYARWMPVVVTTTGVELVYISGGSFQMGNPDSSIDGSNSERPVHTVTVSSFSMSKYQVTQGQYEAVMGSNPSSSYGVGDNYPVYYVSWYDALVFCNKLSVMEDLTPAYRINGSTDTATWGGVPTTSSTTWNAVTIVSDSTGYRLPTEAQWEYAAKGGDGSPGNYKYSGSDTVDEVAWYSGNNGASGTATYGSKEVGTKAPNGLGIYDMSGNLREWCWDWYVSYPSTAQTDPTGASSGSFRVLRGGGWLHSAGGVRSAYRVDGIPGDRYYYGGFRLVRPVQ